MQAYQIFQKIFQQEHKAILQSILSQFLFDKLLEYYIFKKQNVQIYYILS